MERDQILDDILFEIQRNSLECRWFLESHRLAELLQIPKEEYYRKLYNFRSEKYSRSFHSGFYEKDGEFLTEFLEYFLGIPDVAEKFAEAGIYFHESQLKELRENFKSLVKESLLRHELDKDTLLLLATAAIDYDDAVDSYISDKFDIDFFVSRTVHDFMVIKNVYAESGAEIFLKEYLQGLIPTKILNLREITREFRDRSYYELFGKYRESSWESGKGNKKTRTKKKNNPSFDKEYRELMEYFGLREGFQREDLKKEFKSLLKKFHPDINKNGLQKTQEIISKYNALVLILNQKGIP